MQDPRSPSNSTPVTPVGQPLQYMTATANLYAGRKSGLMVFGILMLVGAGLCALVTLAFTASMVVAVPQQVGIRMPLYVIVQTLTIYAAATVGLTCVGIGSIRAKRWVRPVVVPLSAVALIGSLIGLVGVIGQLLELRNSAGAAAVGMLVGIFVLLLFCAVPAAMLWFYGSARTRDALRFYDPHISWAEVVPMPVFAISLLAGLGAISLLSALLMPINPTFGLLLRGPLAVLATAVTFAALVAISALCYRRSMLGWWLAMTVTVLGLASNIGNIATGASRELARDMIDEMYGGTYAATTAVAVQGTQVESTTTLPAAAPTTSPAPAGALPPAITTAQLQSQMRESMYEHVDAQTLVQMLGVVVMGVAVCGYLMWARKYFSPALSG